MPGDIAPQAHGMRLGGQCRRRRLRVPGRSPAGRLQHSHHLGMPSARKGSGSHLALDASTGEALMSGGVYACAWPGCNREIGTSGDCSGCAPSAARHAKPAPAATAGAVRGCAAAGCSAQATRCVLRRRFLAGSLQHVAHAGHHAPHRSAQGLTVTLPQSVAGASGPAVELPYSSAASGQFATLGQRLASSQSFFAKWCASR